MVGFLNLFLQVCLTRPTQALMSSGFLSEDLQLSRTWSTNLREHGARLQRLNIVRLAAVSHHLGPHLLLASLLQSLSHWLVRNQTVTISHGISLQVFLWWPLSCLQWSASRNSRARRNLLKTLSCIRRWPEACYPPR